jgi:hypothetical protein
MNTFIFLDEGFWVVSWRFRYGEAVSKNNQLLTSVISK